jgi:hypothetical protein
MFFGQMWFMAISLWQFVSFVNFFTGTGKENHYFTGRRPRTKHFTRFSHGVT